MDETRLSYEISEMQKVFPGARLFRDDDRMLYWELKYRSYTINVFYPVQYPFVPAEIYIRPALRTHHHSGDLALCWQRGGEWNPSWTAATVIGKAIQFISDYKAGLVED